MLLVLVLVLLVLDKRQDVVCANQSRRGECETCSSVETRLIDLIEDASAAVKRYGRGWKALEEEAKAETPKID